MDLSTGMTTLEGSFGVSSRILMHIIFLLIVSLPEIYNIFCSRQDPKDVYFLVAETP